MGDGNHNRGCGHSYGYISAQRVKGHISSYKQTVHFRLSTMILSE